MIETWVLRLLVLASLALFTAQMATRVRLFVRAKNNIRLTGLAGRLRRVLLEVICQTKVIAEKPPVGVGHAMVFWGFVAFAGYTGVQFLKGLGIADFTGQRWFHLYSLSVVPFALAVLIGMSGLLVRRALVRPEALGRPVSRESLLIGGFIITLMVTFLLDFRLGDPFWSRVSWWVHALVILVFLDLIPGSKHLHLLLSPLTVFLESPGLGTVRSLDFEREEVGLETVEDTERKQVLDAFTCVECGRCQMNCPAYATGKLLNPKKLILQNEEGLLAGKLDVRLSDLYEAGVLWQCTTCGACENQCPVGIEHLPLIIGARRGLVSNGDAPTYLATVYNNLERRGNIWGLTYDQREKFVASAGLEEFDPSRHEYLLWLGCAGAFEADYQKALRALFEILRRASVTFGVLARERCTGDVARRSGNEYLFQELARENIEGLTKAGAGTIVTSCPHCLRTLGVDYRELGFDRHVVHSSVLVDELTSAMPGRRVEDVVFHDPCYLGRYAGAFAPPRELLARFGGNVREPVRTRSNPFCCGAGGGLLFEEHEEGKRISQERLEQLQATGAPTAVTACPFCSIMLKGAQASANTSTEIVDLMTFVNDRLKTA